MEYFFGNRGLIHGKLEPNVLIGVDATGTILSVEANVSPPEDSFQFEGILCPAFINLHCHLELSHLRSQIPQGIGMVPFIQEILRLRDSVTHTEILRAMNSALAELYQTGTIAFCDIANTSLSDIAKTEFPQFYVHTFVEMMGLQEESADTIFKNYEKVLQEFEFGTRSLTVHAPYSISQSLWNKVIEYRIQNPEIEHPLSIHFAESEAEILLFEGEPSPFNGFFETIGVQPNFSFSLTQTILNIPETIPLLLVHNTEVSAEMKSILAERGNIAWCFCPRSNLYLHGKFPNFNLWNWEQELVAIGTDSLASNTSLDLLTEIKLIQKVAPQIPLNLVLKASTENAARILNWKQIGTLNVGKRPGLIHLTSVTEDLRLTDASEAIRLF
ncbi:MAG: amidohydrolase family protein [Bacteroidia bacterium]|nr:amidohydrolase family protein [Bacteroidia bacterium]